MQTPTYGTRFLHRIRPKTINGLSNLNLQLKNALAATGVKRYLSAPLHLGQISVEKIASDIAAIVRASKLTRVGLLGVALMLLASFSLAAATGGAIYRFDELSGATAIDASGAANHGSISGASYVAGFAGSALRFRAGQMDRITVPQSVFTGFGNTVFFEAMIRPNAYPGICGGGSAMATIFRKRAHLNDFQLTLLNDGSLSSVLYGGDGNALDPRTAPNTIPLNSWTKVAAAYDGTKLTIMVNGQIVETQAGQLTLDWAKNYYTTQIGNNTTDGNCVYSFSGDIDAVTISAFQQRIDEKFTQGFPDTWLPSASASVYNGVLNLSSGCVQLPGTYSRAEGLVIEADVTIMNGGIGDFNIWGLYDDLPSCHSGPTNGYYTGWYPTGSDNNQDLIINRTNGATQLLASTATRISAGTLYRIKQEFLPDGTINTYVNGVKTMTANNSGQTTGFITLRAWQNDQIDNVLISSAAASTSFNICTLYDASKPVKSGSTIPIKLQLCDSNLQNQSSSSITLNATSLVQISSTVSQQIQDAGNSNPDNDFRYDFALGSTGGYIFNLKTTGLTTGTYRLFFTATGSNSVYSTDFQVK